MMATPDSFAGRVHDNYDIDFTQLRDGDHDPTLNKHIKSLIIHTNTLIVYLDSDYTVQWSTNSFLDSTGKFGQIINRVGRLESRSEFLRGSDHFEFSRRMLAEGASRILDDQNYDLAQEALDDAEKYINSRNQEFSRGWYFETSFLVTALCMLLASYFWLFKFIFTETIGIDAFEVVFCTCFGSVGALLSTANRNDKIDLDATAGSSVHRIEAIARISAGIIGALIVVLLLKANFLLTFLDSVNNKTALLLVFSIAAGASERLVPNMIKKFEEL